MRYYARFLILIIAIIMGWGVFPFSLFSKEPQTVYHGPRSLAQDLAHQAELLVASEFSFLRAKHKKQKDLSVLQTTLDTHRKEFFKLKKELEKHSVRGAKVAHLASDMLEGQIADLYSDYYLKTSKADLEGNNEKKGLDKEPKLKQLREDQLHIRNLERGSAIMGVISDNAKGLNLSELDKWIRKMSYRSTQDPQDMKVTNIVEALTELRKQARSTASMDQSDMPALERANHEFLKAQKNAWRKTSDFIDENRDFLKEKESSTYRYMDKAYKPVALALQAGMKHMDLGVLKSAGCDPELETCPDLSSDNKDKWKTADTLLDMRKAGASDEEIDKAFKKSIRVAKTDSKEVRDSCSSDGAGSVVDPDWLGTIAGGAGYVLGGAWEVAKTGGKLLFFDLFMEQGGAVVRESLANVFSVLAQYNYQQKGSRSSDTQVWRGLAASFGASVGKSTDPLRDFQREPLSSQQLVSETNQMLFDALTMGGNPNRPGGFPYGTHEQLQAILAGTLQPGPQQGLPIYDPSFKRFAVQSYNGYPPLSGTQVGGAFLNPRFGARDALSRGSGSAAFGGRNLGPSQGISAFNRLQGAAALTADGVGDFADQMERQDLRPQTNSLASLVDVGNQKDASSRALTASEKNLRTALARGPAFLNSFRDQQTREIAERVGAIGSLDAQVGPLIAAVRMLHAEVMPDGDGLMRTRGRDWSTKVAQLNAHLAQLRNIALLRAREIEALAVAQRYPQLYARMRKDIPGSSSSFMVPRYRWAVLKRFFIKPLWAKERRLWVSNWKEILKGELKWISDEKADHRHFMRQQTVRIKKLAALDPAGVHELNMTVVQFEKLNMKAIVAQSEQNLAKLQKAQTTAKTHHQIKDEDRGKILDNIKKYRDAISKLKASAREAAHQLSRVERLQLEKVQQYAAFQHEKALGHEFLKKGTVQNRQKRDR